MKCKINSINNNKKSYCVNKKHKNMNFILIKLNSYKNLMKLLKKSQKINKS